MKAFGTYTRKLLYLERTAGLVALQIGGRVFYSYAQLVDLLGDPIHPISPDPVHSRGVDSATYRRLFAPSDLGERAA
ncbi:MAG: hypothetical protein ACRET2_03690 [Steroidobacteraceae bacterium]